MAATFAFSAVEGRTMRPSASMSTLGLRVQPLLMAHSSSRPTFTHSAIAEPRPQRLIVTKAAFAAADTAEDSETYERDESFQERVIQVRRVTKVVKGGKQLSFRAVVIVGDENGTVGVGCASAKEVVQAVRKAGIDAKRKSIKVPLTKANSFPHKFDGIFGAARVMLRPASEGTGVIAGGAVRVVLELAGVKNAFGKQLGSDNPLNNARATIEGLKAMRTLEQVAAERGLPLEELLPMKKA